MYPQFAPYFRKNWWPHQHRFVRAWLNEYRHFGELSTQRTEGMHAVVKQWIQTSQLDLLNIFQFMENHWLLQHDKYLKDMGRSNDTPEHYRNKFWQSVVRRIHRYPLDVTKTMLRQAERIIELEEKAKKSAAKKRQQRKRRQLQDRLDEANGIVQQQQLSQQQQDDDSPPESPTSKPCTGRYSFTMGLPCQHMLADLIRRRKIPRPLLPQHFAARWWIRPESAASDDFDPRPRDPKPLEKKPSNRQVTHQKGAGENSSRRHFLHAEVLDKNHPAQATSTTPATTIALPSTAPAAVEKRTYETQLDFRVYQDPQEHHTKRRKTSLEQPQQPAPPCREPPPSSFQPPPSSFQPPPSSFKPPPSNFQPLPSSFQPPPSHFEPPRSRFEPIQPLHPQLPSISPLASHRDNIWAPGPSQLPPSSQQPLPSNQQAMRYYRCTPASSTPSREMDIYDGFGGFQQQFRPQSRPQFMSQYGGFEYQHQDNLNKSQQQFVHQHQVVQQQPFGDEYVHASLPPRQYGWAGRNPFD